MEGQNLLKDNRALYWRGGGYGDVTPTRVSVEKENKKNREQYLISAVWAKKLRQLMAIGELAYTRICTYMRECDVKRETLHYENL